MAAGRYPNSPNARAKASTQPAAMPRSDSGRVIVAKRRQAPAPSDSAAATRRRSTLSKATRTVSTSSGKPITAAAITAPVQRNATTTPACSSRMPSGPWRPNKASSA
jgi:hypothetical protein